MTLTYFQQGESRRSSTRGFSLKSLLKSGIPISISDSDMSFCGGGGELSVKYVDSGHQWVTALHKWARPTAWVGTVLSRRCIRYSCPDLKRPSSSTRRRRWRRKKTSLTTLTSFRCSSRGPSQSALVLGEFLPPFFKRRLFICAKQKQGTPWTTPTRTRPPPTSSAPTWRRRRRRRTGATPRQGGRLRKTFPRPTRGRSRSPSLISSEFIPEEHDVVSSSRNSLQ